MQVNHYLDQIETDAGPHDSGNIATAIVTAENVLEVFLWNADAMVLYGDHNLLRFDIDLGSNMNGTPILRVFDGVRNQIAEHLEQQLRISKHWQRRRTP